MNDFYFSLIPFPGCAAIEVTVEPIRLALFLGRLRDHVPGGLPLIPTKFYFFIEAPSLDIDENHRWVNAHYEPLARAIKANLVRAAACKN